MKRKSSAAWTGSSKDGKGTLSTESGVLKNTQYSYSSRFETGIGTNPEELIAAAHAGCFTMALAGMLGEAGYTPDQLDTTATLTMEKTDAGPTVTEIHLEIMAKIAVIDGNNFNRIAAEAKAKCPVSRLLNTSITMNTRLNEKENSL